MPAAHQEVGACTHAHTASTLPPPHTHTPAPESSPAPTQAVKLQPLANILSSSFPSISAAQRVWTSKISETCTRGWHQVPAESQQRWGGGASICVRAWGPSSWLSRTGLQALKPLSIPLSIPDGAGRAAQESPGRMDGLSHTWQESRASPKSKSSAAQQPHWPGCSLPPWRNFPVAAGIEVPQMKKGQLQISPPLYSGPGTNDPS